MNTPVYLDCAATTPIDPCVRREVLAYLDAEYGNAGSRTHDYGRRARSAVEIARRQVGAVVGASRGEVIFTSGATESNNLAILGLADFGLRSGKTHIVTTQIEHNAVLEPVAELERRGFHTTCVRPNSSGFVTADSIREALRPETLLVSVMHVNNETGVLQPVEEIAVVLERHDAFLHVDAAQSYGKSIEPLRHSRIDLISVSGHKIHAPKGIGALITRRRGADRLPLTPLMHGGGQERGLRPGTLPVAMIAGLGKAARLAGEQWMQREQCCRAFRDRLLEGLAPLQPSINGDLDHSLPNIVNLSIPGVDAEAAMEAWKDLAAVTNGAACASQHFTCSHVLSAMGLSEDRKMGALRLSWCHFSEMPDTAAMVDAIRAIL